MWNDNFVAILHYLHLSTKSLVYSMDQIMEILNAYWYAYWTAIIISLADRIWNEVSKLTPADDTSLFWINYNAIRGDQPLYKARRIKMFRPRFWWWS